MLLLMILKIFIEFFIEEKNIKYIETKEKFNLNGNTTNGQTLTKQEPNQSNSKDQSQMIDLINDNSSQLSQENNKEKNIKPQIKIDVHDQVKKGPSSRVVKNHPSDLIVDSPESSIVTRKLCTNLA